MIIQADSESTRGSRRGDRGISCEWKPLLQLYQRVIGADGVHGLDHDLINDAVAVGADALFHLHGFDHAHFLAGGDLVTGPDHDGDDASR